MVGIKHDGEIGISRCGGVESLEASGAEQHE